MKRLMKITGIGMGLLLILALIMVAPALAQGPNPSSNNGGGGPCQVAGLLDVDPAEMHAAIAEALGVSVEEFEAARAGGTTLFQLAQQLGVEMDVVREAMSAVREAAIDEALAAGEITEAQAQWLKTRPGAGGYGYGYGYRGGLQNGHGFGAKGHMRGQGRQFGGPFGGRGFGARMGA